MVDKHSDKTEQTLQEVEKTADEPILAAMVKTAILANVEGVPADVTVPMSEVMDKMELREDKNKQDV